MKNKNNKINKKELATKIDKFTSVDKERLQKIGKSDIIKAFLIILAAVTVIALILGGIAFVTAGIVTAIITVAVIYAFIAVILALTYLIIKKLS